MKKFFESKYTIVFLAGAGLVALVLLAAALRHFTFKPAEPFSIGLFWGGMPGLVGTGTAQNIPAWKIILFVVVMTVIFVVVLVLMDAEARKKLLLRLFRFAMTVLAISFLMDYAYKRGTLKEILNGIPSTLGNAEAAPGTALPQYVPPQISPWLIFAVSFAVALALVLLGWFLYRLRSQRDGPHTLVEIANIAREALRGLEPGGDWDDAIVRAYVRMNQVVTSERGLVRQPGATPSEFARGMERAGLPGEAVNTLTHLFEGVRYGGKKASQAERDLAAAALSAIARACGVNP